MGLGDDRNNSNEDSKNHETNVGDHGSEVEPERVLSPSPRLLVVTSFIGLYSLEERRTGKRKGEGRGRGGERRQKRRTGRGRGGERRTGRGRGGEREG